MCWVNPVPGSRAASCGSDLLKSNWQFKICIHRSTQLKNGEVDGHEGYPLSCIARHVVEQAVQWLSEFYLVRNTILTGLPSLAFSCHSPPM